MKTKLIVMLCLLALLVVPAAGYGASAVEEGATITALGYGVASAPPDSVRVDLYINEEPTYGPGGPKLVFVQPADLEDVQNLLVKNGVDEETIEINTLSTDYAYGSNSPAGEISFIYSDVAGLRTMLQAVLDEMEGRRGPNIQAARFVFMVEDCAALEEEAMQAALNDARTRAARMAGLLEMTPGPIRSLSEDISSSGVAAPAGGCIALESLAPSGAYSFLRNAGSAATNNMNEVEVAISLKATFALEPAR